MFVENIFKKVGISALLLITASPGAVAKSLGYSKLSTNPNGDISFDLGANSYLANVRHPSAELQTSKRCEKCSSGGLIPFTVVNINNSVVTGKLLKNTIDSYSSRDDVFTTDFLDGFYLAYTGRGTPTLDRSAIKYLESLDTSLVVMDKAFKKRLDGGSSDWASKAQNHGGLVYARSKSGSLPPGPYAASIDGTDMKFNKVYRLYTDQYRDFLHGTYDANDGQGTWNSCNFFSAQQWFPLIPVPSRIYSWEDPRPLAGYRVAVKDLYDMKGLKTSAGSQAWLAVHDAASDSAPAVQRIIDQGGVLVGKSKLAQFAGGSNGWDWQDEHYPWNPRGDGYLSCGSSSSGGGCSVAAYDWLDFAIGSDTEQSVRRPGSVSGMMNLERVVPIGAVTDTAGVFCRDPRMWAKFAKAWYAPELHQSTNVTGLEPLSVPDTRKFPKRVIYLSDYLPMQSPAAEAILQGFLSNMTRIFGMNLEKKTFRSLVEKSDPPIQDIFMTTGPIETVYQYQHVGKPLFDAYRAKFDGRFPPVERVWRSWGKESITKFYTQPDYDAALITKGKGVSWFERNVLYSTKDSCSESILIYDIGTGGLPSFREQYLNSGAGSTSLGGVPKGALFAASSICPIFGCVDMVLPIGQVAYQSNVTFHEEYVPVTVSVIAKRGCDFMLFNMWTKLAEAGVLNTVKTGRTAF